MLFTEITTPYEKKKMIVYGSERNKLVKHNVNVRQVEGNIYMGEVECPDWCNFPRSELYFYLAKIGIGIKIGSVAAEDDTERSLAYAKSQDMDSAKNFIGYLDSCLERKFIPKNMLALAAEIKPENISRYVSSNEKILRLREEQWVAEQAAREQADAAYVAEKNREAQAKVDAAVRILRNDGILANVDIELYRSRYDRRVYSVVNHLMRRYGIKVPLRTQGWINDKLATATIRDGVCAHVQYRKTKNGKGSQAVFGFLSELAQAARKEAAHETVA